MTSIFNTRYFNSIERLNGTDLLRKTSTDHEKLRAEYDYWYSLPKELSGYFVKPENFTCDGYISSYDMKAYPMRNAADILVSGEMDEASFNKMFSHIETYREIASRYSKQPNFVSSYGKSLVVAKTANRVKELNNSIWSSSSQSVLLKLNGITADDLLLELKEKYEKYCGNRKITSVVLSHGDLTFSNILWDDHSDSIMFVDPKGSDYMYLDDYYDLAKLSQSIFGKYDYILYGRYNLSLRDANLSIEINSSDSHLKTVFLAYLQKYNIDYNLLRLYEASLFLSMAPLHLEDLQRVSALLINCKNILNSL